MSATAVKHKHAWKASLHLDGCHWYTTSYTCTKCSAVATVTRERDPKKLMTGMWMEPQYVEITRDERGRFLPKDQRRWEEKICIRCKELQNGAKVRYDMVIVNAKTGEIEVERHQEFEQRPDEDEDE
jgi:hypothetical protein